MKTTSAMMLFSIAAPLGTVIGAPLLTSKGFLKNIAGPKRLAVRQDNAIGCNLSNVKLNLFQGALDAGLSVDPNEHLSYVVVGRGVQNATCTNGVYANGMALATLYDVSCDLSTESFTDAELSENVKDFKDVIPFENSGGQLTQEEWDAISVFVIGDHYFDAQSRPTFDFRRTGKGDFASGKKDANVTDPFDSTNNVPWLQLTTVEGTAADHFYRAYTAGGVAPKTCSEEGSVGRWDYAALYYFYKK